MFCVKLFLLGQRCVQMGVCVVRAGGGGGKKDIRTFRERGWEEERFCEREGGRREERKGERERK